MGWLSLSLRLGEIMYSGDTPLPTACSVILASTPLPLSSAPTVVSAALA
jgi:hypothetical protein